MSLANDLAAAFDAAARDGIEKIVVGAIISKSNKVLVLRRREDDFLGGLDELPSGHVEDGEGLPDALRREVKEETGLEVSRILHLVGRFDYLTKKPTKSPAAELRGRGGAQQQNLPFGTQCLLLGRLERRRGPQPDAKRQGCSGSVLGCELEMARSCSITSRSQFGSGMMALLL